MSTSKFFLYLKNSTKTTFIFRVKPAVFDLFLSMMIASYLVLVYFMLIHFSKLYQIVSKFSTPTPTANGANHKNKVM